MIQPPNTEPPPKWADDLVRAANSRNRARGSDASFSICDLICIWKKCQGRCSVSGLEFHLTIVGDGQAKRPFAPSLDRIDRHQPYTRENVRLVTSVANFAMNAWGIEPLLELAAGISEYRDPQNRQLRNDPPDAELTGEAVLNDDRLTTDHGNLSYPPHSERIDAILDILRSGPAWSRDIEILTAERFGLDQEHRKAFHLTTNTLVWRNLIALGLRELVMKREIRRLKSKKAESGGQTGFYERYSRDSR